MYEERNNLTIKLLYCVWENHEDVDRLLFVGVREKGGPWEGVPGV